MMKKSKMVGLAGVTLSVFFYVTILMLPTEVEAKLTYVAVKGARYNVNFSMEDNLKSFLGKKISVTLDSGKTFTGFVKAVGNHLLHLEKLNAKEFYDALLRIEDISAIETKFRNLQR